MDCSCGMYIDGVKSCGAPCVPSFTSCAQVEYGIPYCDCSEFAEQSPEAAGEESEDDVSPFGGLLAGDLTTPPFVPPNAERSWMSSGNVSECIIGGPPLLEQYVAYVCRARLQSFSNIGYDR